MENTDWEQSHPLQDSARYAARMLDNQAELIERIKHSLPEDGVLEALEGLFLARASAPMGLIPGVIAPSLCLIAQGSKVFFLGDSQFRYDPDHYLITTLEMPLVSQILEATPDKPYLSILIQLTPSLVGSVIENAGQKAYKGNPNIRAMDVSRMDVNLQDAVLRLVRLVEAPEKMPFLLPLIKQEIVYLLLMGQQGTRLRHLSVHGMYTPNIAKAVEQIRQGFNQQLNIEELANGLGVSVSGLYHQFKTVTAMSPLQFQKQLRLQEARRLMLNEDFDAASAAYQVGYRDPAFFNREYKKLFGDPPIRHVQHLREDIQIRSAIKTPKK